MESNLWGALALLGVLLMRVGFAVHGAGMVRAKNSAGILLRHLTDLCVATLSFVLIGMALGNPSNRFLGIDWKLLLAWDDSASSSAFWNVGAVLIATAILPGVLAERTRFWAGIAPTVLLAGFIVPIASHWASWRGWIGGKLVFLDFGGAAALHLTAAICAGMGAYFVGARTGKFNRDGSSTAIPGHSVPLAGAGTSLLVVGWILFLVARGGAFNAGSTLRSVMIALSAGGLAALVFSQIRYYKPDLHLIVAGMLGALVAVSAGAPGLGSLGALLIGAVAGVIVPAAILMLDVMFRIDDPSGGIAIHGVGAIWGLFATPLVAHGLSIGERFKAMGGQLLGVAVIAGMTFALSLGLWTLLKRSTKIRATEHDEFDGLDLAEHDIGAYPDFQQTMIKSYHLREM